MGDLFGGGGTDVEQISTLTPGQRDLLSELTGLLRGQVGQGITPFGGLRPGEVPFGPLQQQAFGLAGGLAPGIGAGIDIFGQALGQFDPTQGQGLLGQATQALQGATQPFDPQSVLSALEPGRQLALRTFERDIVPDILERFGATSGASGALDRALAEAGAGLSLGLGAQAAGPLIQGQQAQLNRQLQGAGLFGNLAQLPGQLAGQGIGLGGAGIGQLSNLLNIGGLQRTLPQGIAGAQQARFQEAQPFANPFLSLLPQALGTQAFQNIGVQQAPGVLSGALGGLGTGLGQQIGQQGLGGILGGLGGLFGGGGLPTTAAGLFTPGGASALSNAWLGGAGMPGMAAGAGGAGGLLGGIGNLAGGAIGGIGGLAGGAAGLAGGALGGLGSLLALI